IAELDFFFQAEDGIRDFHVTGVQTCALPIYVPPPVGVEEGRALGPDHEPGGAAADGVVGAGGRVDAPAGHLEGPLVEFLRTGAWRKSVRHQRVLQERRLGGPLRAGNQGGRPQGLPRRRGSPPGRPFLPWAPRRVNWAGGWRSRPPLSPNSLPPSPMIPAGTGPGPGRS